MAAQSYEIIIEGYWRDTNKSGIPDKSGVYFVFRCTHNVKEGNVTLHQLIYIGESGDVRDRIENHEKYKEWLTYLKTGEQLCFSFGPIDSYNRDRVEAAYIFKHKPPVNVEYKNAFPFDQIKIYSKGKIMLITPVFTVNRT